MRLVEADVDAGGGGARREGALAGGLGVCGTDAEGRRRGGGEGGAAVRRGRISEVALTHVLPLGAVALDGGADPPLGEPAHLRRVDQPAPQPLEVVQRADIARGVLEQRGAQRPLAPHLVRPALVRDEEPADGALELRELARPRVAACGERPAQPGEVRGAAETVEVECEENLTVAHVEQADAVEVVERVGVGAAVVHELEHARRLEQRAEPALLERCGLELGDIENHRGRSWRGELREEELSAAAEVDALEVDGHLALACEPRALRLALR
eukprot:CAMPEP_0182821742 /NCGR_PEP_ID=MMETSP0006_2-20121128/13837_1 /TAXON_ID=97485 /ORGANISM="Prymnesium parvum, Strain Texoma1" /LENGTH=270 /DNA_ID=CAMNT_0024948529 /DNA_START=107 /DNA_END=916 /DNA_ORIENTATION=+